MAADFEIKITPQALSNMREINDYIAHEIMNPDAARNLLDKMQQEINNLAAFPKKYRLVDEEPWRSEGVRKIVVDNYLVYYWIDEENSIIQIIAVMSERRDQIAQLSKIKKK